MSLSPGFYNEIELTLEPARLPDPTTIPPRKWLYGSELIRGFVSVLVSPGGTGKTAYAMMVAACCALHRNLLGNKVFQQVNCAVFNLEDPMEELERRLAAIMIHHKIKERELRGRYFLHSAESRKVVIAQLDKEGFEVIYPDKDALIAQFIANKIGIAVVDPFSESHSLEENSNPHMVKAMAAWREVARETNAAILLVHHVRKGTSLDIEAARGAKAMTDSARVGLLMTPMSPEEAVSFDLTEEERIAYVRLDNAKTNMAPKAAEARWFKLAQVELGNTEIDDLYPNGDRVAALEQWQAPRTMHGVAWTDIIEILDRVQEGPSPGELYTETKKGRNNDRWVGDLLCEIADRTPAQARIIIKLWMKSELLIEREYDSAKSKRQVIGLV